MAAATQVERFARQQAKKRFNAEVPVIEKCPRCVKAAKDGTPAPADCFECGLLKALREVPRGQHEFRLMWNVLDSIGHLHTKHEVKRPSTQRAAKDKSALVFVYLSLLSLNVLPQDGRERKNSRAKASYEAMARAIGYLFRGSIGRQIGKAIPAIDRKKTFGGPSRWWWALPEGSTGRYQPKHYEAPTAAELAEIEKWQKYWSKKKSRRRYDWIAGWLFHPNCPGTPYAKAVLAYLMAIGICRIDKRGHVRNGKVNPNPRTIARDLGLSPTCVRTQLAFWKSLGILQIVPRRGHRHDKTREWVQPSSDIVWLPGRTFDQDQAVREYARVLAATERWRDTKFWGQFDSIVQSTLKEWTGTERHYETYLAKLVDRLHAANTPQALIADVIKPPPPG